MSSKADFFIKKTLGEDFLESLQKFELWKPGTRTTIDHEELKTALQIVPRIIMSFLIKELAPLEIGENKRVSIPVKEAATLNATKLERDVYSGNVEQDGKVLVDFKYRSIPGIGLIIMSAFELYDINNLHGNVNVEHSDTEKLQQLIDERLHLHDLIGKVIDKKLMEREAIGKLVLSKLTDIMQEKEKKEQAIVELTKIQEETTPQTDEYFRGMTNGLKVAESVVTGKDPEFVPPQKGSEKLKKFLHKRKNNREFAVQLTKSQVVNCPDCGKDIFKDMIFSGCICLGSDMDKKLFIKKTEDGIKVRFGKNWDQENIEMLLEILRRRHG